MEVANEIKNIFNIVDNTVTFVLGDSDFLLVQYFGTTHKMEFWSTGEDTGPAINNNLFHYPEAISKLNNSNC